MPPHYRRLWHRPTILRRDPGLAASPPARYTLRVARRESSPCLCLLPSNGTDKLLAKRWRAAYGCASLAQADVQSAYGCSRGTRSSFPAGKARTSSAPPSPEVVAPRECGAKLTKRTLDGRRSSKARQGLPVRREGCLVPGLPHWPDVLAVARRTHVRINHGRTPVRADTVTGRLPASAWHRHSAGAGAKGLRYYDWAWVEANDDPHRHLLVRRNSRSGELAFYLCWSPNQVSLSELVRVAGRRSCAEECFQAAKGQVGLDQYQVRHWTAWHRHVTLAMFALGFLAALAADTAPAGEAQPIRPAWGTGPIDLTVPEFRHLLAALLIRPRASPMRLLHWSSWRGHHQATAGRSHYRRQLLTFCAPPPGSRSSSTTGRPSTRRSPSGESGCPPLSISRVTGRCRRLRQAAARTPEKSRSTTGRASSCS